MSSGPRIQLATAQAVANYVFGCWGLDQESSTIVGSVRRLRPDVGDIEIVAPWSPANADELFKILDEDARPPGVLFEPRTQRPPITSLRGLHPAFLEASIVAHVLEVGSKSQLDVPVQIARYKPGQRGWRLIMRTGPSEFGQWFLARWKRERGIPPERPASVDGFLVDRNGRAMEIDSEAEAFALCRLPFIQPHLRESFLETHARRST